MEKLINIPFNYTIMKIGLALGSGGAKGLAHIGVLKVFDELKIKPSVISGSSMGAFIGALYASGISGDQMIREYKKLSLAQMTSMLDFRWNRKYGFIKGERAIEYFRKNMRCRDFKDTKIPLKVVATDFWNQEQVVFTEGDISEAVRASISIPGLFEPHVYDNRVYIDGGIMNPVPFDIIKDECDIVVAVDVFSSIPINNIHPDKPRLMECMISGLQMMAASIEKNKMLHYKPDIYMNMNVGGTRILEFHKLDSILEATEEDLETLRTKLQAVRKVFKE